MPSCQAFNCTNEKGKCNKSFFVIPDPTKSDEKKRLCKQWINNLKNGKLRFETFTYSNSRVVCEDHFTEESFERNLVAESLNFLPKKKRLVPTAVPTLINTDTKPKAAKRKSNARSTVSQSKRQKAQIKENLRRELSEKASKSTDLNTTPSTSSQPSEIDSDVIENMPDEVVSINPPGESSLCNLPADFEYQQIGNQTHTGQEAIWVKMLATQDKVPTMSADEESTMSGRNISNMSAVGSCGHPCLMCLQSRNVDSSVLVNDHIYSKPQEKRTRTIGLNTDESLLKSTTDIMEPHQLKTIINSGLPILSSTPIKQDDFDETDFSFHDDHDDSKDVTFHLSDEEYSKSDDDHDISGDEDEDSYENAIVKQRKFIVFENQLDQLLARIKCNECVCPVEPSDTKKDFSSGSNMKVNLYCTGGHSVLQWNSQPTIGKMPAGNLLLCAATLFSGQTFSRISQFSEIMNLKIIGKTTFQIIQREVLMPVVTHAWSLIQKKLLDRIKESNRCLRLSGDGRCDSPGFSAKYCTYTLMDMETQQILTFVTIKVTETGSSTRMEAEGFRRCMEYLLDQGFTIEVLATDRHVQIRSIMSKKFENVDHQFDVWHLANSLRKKLQAKAKIKANEDLGPWIRAICNHLWWCSSNCDGNKQWLEESFVSIVHHVANIHSFEGELFTSCAHAEIPVDQARLKKWLPKGSKAHNALKEIILDKRLRKDIKHLSEFCHTGNLEVYHSLLTKYVPKRQEFDHDQMNARTTMAVIDHNMSQNRGQKLDRDGQPVFRTAFSKATGKWAAKPVYNPKTYKWIENMTNMCVWQKENMMLPKIDVTCKGNIAPIPAPPKSELVQNLVSRFKTM